MRFETPWRHHVVVLSLWGVAALAACLVLYHRGPSPAARRAGLFAACLLILAGPVAWIGAFEGGYNHLLKNAVYFGGLPHDAFARLVPPPSYEPPSDWFFELTGVLQFPLGVLAGAHALHWWRTPQATFITAAP